jgi:hypothetical protein
MSRLNITDSDSIDREHHIDVKKAGPPCKINVKNGCPHKKGGSMILELGAMV